MQGPVFLGQGYCGYGMVWLWLWLWLWLVPSWLRVRVEDSLIAGYQQRQQRGSSCHYLPNRLNGGAQPVGTRTEEGVYQRVCCPEAADCTEGFYRLTAQEGAGYPLYGAMEAITTTTNSILISLCGVAESGKSLSQSTTSSLLFCSSRNICQEV